MKRKKKQISMGKCSFCEGIFLKDEMLEHLESCEQRKMNSPMEPTGGGKSRHRDKRIFHLIVEGRGRPEYWLHLDVPAVAKLKDLDDFLRGIWLECCGHLSAFTIDEVRYEEDGDGENSFMYPPTRNIDIHSGNVLYEGLKGEYVYDFGTATRLTLEVLSEREEDIKDKSIRLLARNEPPQRMCVICGGMATQVCGYCLYDDSGWVCDKCVEKHECGEEMMLPVVNSPRVGKCGYTGESKK